MSDPDAARQMFRTKRLAHSKGTAKPCPLYRLNEEAAINALFFRVRKHPTIGTIYGDLTGCDAYPDVYTQIQNRIVDVYADTHDGKAPEHHNRTHVRRNGKYKYDAVDLPVMFAVVWQHCVAYDIRVRERFVIELPSRIAERKRQLSLQCMSQSESSLHTELGKQNFWSHGDADRIREMLAAKTKIQQRQQNVQRQQTIIRGFLTRAAPASAPVSAPASASATTVQQNTSDDTT